MVPTMSAANDDKNVFDNDAHLLSWLSHDMVYISVSVCLCGFHDFDL